MTDAFAPAAPPPSESYSPQFRTALVLTGTGTAGAYHAGVLRALHEAGVKVDVVAGHGIGVVGALFAAIDAAPRLWDDKGVWRASAVHGFYGWRWTLRVAAWALAAALAIVALPLAALASGLVVYPIDFLLKMLGASGTEGLVAAYLRVAHAAFAPEALPTWLPRLVVLVLGAAGAIVAVAAWTGRGPRRRRGAAWWGMVRAPLVSHEAVRQLWRVMWDALRGAAQVRSPTASELGRRYTELLAENIGQPGFRELLFVVHDLDAHTDLVFALVDQRRRRDLVRRSTNEAADMRRRELFDLAGVAREYLADAVGGALSVPLATDPQPLRFAPESAWRGETHRLADRSSCLARLVEELRGLDVHQVILVSASPDASGPHALRPPRLDGRGRFGEYLQSAEGAILRDVIESAAGGPTRLFTIRPAHNPIGPFDFAGGFDDQSDRPQPLDELINRGYEDAYHQFIEPVVGASGERVGSALEG